MWSYQPHSETIFSRAILSAWKMWSVIEPRCIQNTSNERAAGFPKFKKPGAYQFASQHEPGLFFEPYGKRMPCLVRDLLRKVKHAKQVLDLVTLHLSSWYYKSEASHRIEEGVAAMGVHWWGRAWHLGVAESWVSLSFGNGSHHRTGTLPFRQELGHEPGAAQSPSTGRCSFRCVDRLFGTILG